MTSPGERLIDAATEGREAEAAPLVEQAVLDAMGVSYDQLVGMGLREVFELAQARGYDIRVTPATKARDGHGRLSVVMAREGNDAAPEYHNAGPYVAGERG